MWYFGYSVWTKHTHTYHHHYNINIIMSHCMFYNNCTSHQHSVFHCMHNNYIYIQVAALATLALLLAAIGGADISLQYI